MCGSSKGLAVIAAVFLTQTACGSFVPPRGSASSRPRTEPTSASAPSAGLSCRIPVFGVIASSGRYLGAFIGVPGGQVSVDDNSEVVRGAGQSWHTVAQPTLYGYPDGSFDWAAQRWVPVPRALVSPDGLSYAYAEVPFNPNTTGDPFSPSRIHVVTVATGTDRVAYSQGYYGISGYEREGIYLVHHIPQTDGSDSVFLLDPVGGTLKTIHAGGVNWKVEGGSGWSADVAPEDATPPGKATGDRLLRLDLKTGAATPWLRRPGFAVSELGVDSTGATLAVAANQQAQEVWAVTAPEVARQVYAGPGWASSDVISFNYRSVVDDHGVWLLGRSALYLYSPGVSLAKVVDTPFAANNGTPAGSCR